MKQSPKPTWSSASSNHFPMTITLQHLVPSLAASSSQHRSALAGRTSHRSCTACMMNLRPSRPSSGSTRRIEVSRKRAAVVPHAVHVGARSSRRLVVVVIDLRHQQRQSLERCLDIPGPISVKAIGVEYPAKVIHPRKCCRPHGRRRVDPFDPSHHGLDVRHRRCGRTRTSPPISSVVRIAFANVAVVRGEVRADPTV
jgi:hypothetical protein